MTYRMDIFWPQMTAPDIWEVQDSYRFCRKTSQRLCDSVSGIAWTDYPADAHMRQIIDGAKSDVILVVTDPEVVFSLHALIRLQKALGDGHEICAPVYNLSDYPMQQAQLSAPYLNVTGYVEMSRRISEMQTNYYSSPQSLDPSCILYRRDYLVSRFQSDGQQADVRPVQMVSSIASASAVIDPGALFHRFGNYYESERLDLVRLVPDHVRRVLDVGCARGGYGKTLKQLRPDITITGVEFNAVMAETASQHYDHIINTPVEKADFDDVFDLVNCGDLLEHLDDPWRILRRIYHLLAPGGYLVLSVPNAGHWTVVQDLLKGKFEYIPVGLLCVSHVRWFTEISLREALTDAGFRVELLERQQHVPTPDGQKFIDNLCMAGYGNELSLKTNEFIVRAVKS